eukprot:gene5250-5302_t
MMMRKRSVASTMASLRRTGTRLFRKGGSKLFALTSDLTVGMASGLLKAPAVPVARPAARRKAKAPGVRANVFSPNPGALEMFTHVPERASQGAPLVVLLHGCGQQAESFATETGWRKLADRLGIVLLMPGQVEANNSQGCFNWFRPADTGHDLGEAGSIAAMVRTVIGTEGCDPARVFVTGLSAGGAMAACLLAAYPEMFAAGAIVAGLPAGAATGVVGAMTRMSGHGGDLSPAEWMSRARSRAPIGYAGPWPRLSIWHGDADTVVAPRNSVFLAQQWTALLGVDAAPAVALPKPGVRHESWGRAGEPALVESWEIAGMGHLYPTEASSGISAAREIAGFWGLAA